MKRWAPLVGLLILAVLASLLLGYRPITPVDLWQALTAPDPTDAAHVTIRSIRFPRTVAGLACGGALGAAGLAIQALTRNPLADPGVLGINAGAAFAVVLGSLVLGQADAGLLAVLAFPGAALAAAAVFALGGGLRGNVSPVRLTLAGAALNALLLSLVTAAVLMRGETLDVVRFWIVGSLAEARARPLTEMALAAGAGALLILALAPKLEALSLGDALSRGLGTRPGRVQAGALVCISLLTGAAVAIAGPIAFLGLMVPPIARRLVGAPLRPGLIAAALLGASILLLADTAGRLLFAPAEIRAGVMTALLGGPIFVLIARRIRPGAVG
ncbi:iron ABC transporter permease [Thalassobaculum sp. OXR-137]|uniref:FecCD family ABC transporter permease n=1 Tax=Thalassobaculum sp. OXR-137 TaxID=3100173 RepID=UPI002AC89C69|nr:iron ABC transporter permease [Thalassobaculum sp. OXR-137]WPZ32717.1 iron ABC transporter permease [Thalassobaculum sp. OXR-137]